MKKILLGLIGLLFAIPSFASNNLPSEYTELQYIESTGTQYITTDVIANQNTSAEIKFVPTSVYMSNSVFGARTSKTSDAFNIWEPGIEGVIIANLGNKGTVVSNVTPVLNETYVVYLSSTRFSVNDYTTTISGTENFSTPSGLQLFNIYGGNCSTTTSSGAGNRFFSGKVYYFKVWQGDSLALNLIPAKNSSGVVGMYDTVSGTFFTNAGSGTFTAGPVIPEQQIRIATTAYNSARFSPVVTELNDTIATIRSVVTNTINQTAAIADLQATKQTRPDETCPAGKKCLLVEDNDGTPHWFEIVESAD
ncbi:MAG: hypothetical protein IJS34_02540 [Alphaproteobacteria bacterium]|nr:hypothetical protein [Alphaproteobacteria bacterium]